MSDRDAVAAADDQFFAALNTLFSGDAAPMEALWSHADDVVYMGPSAEIFDIGWKPTDRDWRVQGAAHLGGHIQRRTQYIIMGQDLATVHHLAEVMGQPSDQQRPPTTLRGTNVYRNEAGTWKLVAHHSDPLPYIEV